MSRAIDADALMKAMYHRAFETDEDTMWQSGCWVRYRAIEQTVKEQPTIEPERKKGEWIVQDNPKMQWYGHWKCDQCGTASYDKDNFCSHCGADLREDDNVND